ncbi:MAG: hypothetical protein E7558_09085 [Ruminococcaceae bacterium]|nr:hypothetical protein [Oscillospiraceae bacterium]
MIVLFCFVDSRGQDRLDTFCIRKTGAGKSLCYQIPALMLPKYTVVISPITALIDDQVEALKKKV